MNLATPEHLSTLIDLFREYAIRYPEERTIISGFYDLLESWPASLDRDHMPGHLTGSAWVLSPDGGSVLLLHHRKLDRWLQPGGHADGEGDLAAVAVRELREETGISGVPVYPEIFDIDIHDIPARGDIPEHQHFDVRFCIVPSVHAEPRNNHESHGVVWQPLDRVDDLTREESIRRMVEKSRSCRGGSGGAVD
jgi:8-oxo-dGTP pyrophosphatase MutT (NUDIX family)